MIAYKDIRNNLCLLEKISGSKKSPIYKLPVKKEEEPKERENDKVSKMFYLSNVVLKRKKVCKYLHSRFSFITPQINLVEKRKENCLLLIIMINDKANFRSW